MHDSGPDPDQEAKARRQAQLEQHHLEVYRNMHRLREALRCRYAGLLRDKVQSQRLLLQQREEAAREKAQSHTKQKQKRLNFSKLQHDDSYLKSLPKTSFYLIFDLQQQLAERGQLKTHHNLEDFYGCITYHRHPSQLLKSLEDVRIKMLESRPAADVITQDQASEKHPCTAEDRGHEDHSRLLERRSASNESLAELIFDGGQEKDEIEQMFPKAHIRKWPRVTVNAVRGVGGGGRGAKRDTSTVGNDTGCDTYDFYTMMKAPTFATLQPNFMRNFQSKMPDLIIPEIPEKSRKAGIYLTQLRRMHDLCLSNMAFSQRLLDREADSPCWQEQRGNTDLMLPGIDSKRGRTGHADQPPLCSAEQPRSVQIERPSRPQELSRMTSARCSLGSQQCFDTLRETPDPLSIEDVCQQKNVEIIDCGFKLWRNYTENTDH